MTLSVDALKGAVRPLFSVGGMPKTAQAAISAWASAYASYAQAATAGGVFPGPLAPVAVPGPFFEALDQTLRAMWVAVPWVGPGLVGSTTVVPALSPPLQGVGSSLLRSRDPEAALSAITNALHTYTLGIAVTVVTPTGASSVVPVT